MEKLWHGSYAPGIPKSLNYKDTTLIEAFSLSVKEFPEKSALIFLDSAITYAKLNDMVNSFANALIDLGVKPGDRVAMLMPNMPQIVIATYGAWKAGAVVVMNNPLYTDHELEYQLNNSGTKVLVTIDLLGPRMIALRKKTGVEKIIIAHIRDHLKFPKKQLLPIVAKSKHREIPPQKDVYEWMGLLKKYPSTNPGIRPDINSLANLQYTGGTTGVSKGVMMSHKNFSYNIQHLLQWFPQYNRGEMTMLGVLPFFHSFGLTCVMNYCLWHGSTIIMIPRPETKTILEAIQKYRINFFPAVPTIYIGLLNYPGLSKYDISSIEGCFSGAAPLPVEVIKEFEGKTGSQICEGYGLSETGPVVTINPLGGITKPGSVGLPIFDTDIKIVDLEDGSRELPNGESGEVIIKGHQVTEGYYKMPDESAMVLKDGWLYTGDIGKFDDEGYLYIVDRKKDMIIAGGFNIYPRDIDEILFEHPKILEACAIGIPDDYRGETVKVFIVLKEGETMTAGEVIEYCSGQLAKYKVPRVVEFISSLPKSNIGKILRRELRAMELEKIKK